MRSRTRVAGRSVVAALAATALLVATAPWTPAEAASSATITRSDTTAWKLAAQEELPGASAGSSFVAPATLKSTGGSASIYVRFRYWVGGQVVQYKDWTNIGASTTSRALNFVMPVTSDGTASKPGRLELYMHANTTLASGVSVTMSNITFKFDVATVYGMNISPGNDYTSTTKDSNDGVTESAQDQVDRIVRDFGGLPSAKTFIPGPLPSTFVGSDADKVPGRVSAVCFKYGDASKNGAPNQQVQMANGAYDTEIMNYVNSIPAGDKVLLVNYQEPDDEMWKTTDKDGNPIVRPFTPQEHKAATEHLIDIVHASPAYAAGRVEVWDIYMGYSTIESTRFNPADVSSRLDGIGWDYYWNGTGPYDTNPGAELATMANAAKNLGIKKWGLFETGDEPHPDDPNGTARAAFWQNVYDTATAQDYSYVMYFNLYGTTGDHRIVPSTPRGGPTANVLRTFMQ